MCKHDFKGCMSVSDKNEIILTCINNLQKISHVTMSICMIYFVWNCLCQLPTNFTINAFERKWMINYQMIFSPMFGIVCFCNKFIFVQFVQDKYLQWTEKTEVQGYNLERDLWKSLFPLEQRFLNCSMNVVLPSFLQTSKQCYIHEFKGCAFKVNNPYSICILGFSHLL